MTMSHELGVWLSADRLGTLELSDGRLNFRYDPAWLSRPGAVALSHSLPLGPERFDDHRTRPFFAGLLPEGRLRAVLARQLQVSRENDFALLDQIGGECAGAVTLLAQGGTPPAPPPDGDVRWLDDAQVVALLDELPQRPMLAGKDGLRLSLAGAQDKLPVVFDGARIGLPRAGSASSHILKPAIRSLEDSVTNEGFCMALAAAMRLSPANSAIHVVSGQCFLLVERYDRVVDAEGRRQRLHQEDFCQALGVPPEAKYQNEGGPDLAQCFELLRRMTRPSAPQILRMLDCVIYNALIGNNDAHGKNFSLLHPAGSAVLAPFYDLLSTAVYPSLAPRMAMKLGSTYKFSEVHARHWEQFAQAAGLSRPQAKKRVLEQATLLPTVARQLLADPARGYAGHPLVERIVALIEQRCELTIRRLRDPSAGAEVIAEA
jgi:serine/threonine-protein kinase HipA